jgi:hypothetical protein
MIKNSARGPDREEFEQLSDERKTELSEMFARFKRRIHKERSDDEETRGLLRYNLGEDIRPNFEDVEESAQDLYDSIKEWFSKLEEDSLLCVMEETISENLKHWSLIKARISFMKSTKKRLEGNAYQITSQRLSNLLLKVVFAIDGNGSRPGTFGHSPEEIPIPIVFQAAIEHQQASNVRDSIKAIMGALELRMASQLENLNEQYALEKGNEIVIPPTCSAVALSLAS